MRLTKRITLRRVILFAWIVMALMIVAPVLAQDGGNPPQETDTPRTTPVQDNPQDLSEIAVELAPLLLGAALIERLLEYIFTLAETSLLRAGRVAGSVMAWINGTVAVDARNIYQDYEQLRAALLKHHAGLIDESMPRNPESTRPDDWPFDRVLEQFEHYGAKIAQLENWLDTTTSSEAFINRRKNVASVLGIVFGLALGGIADLRMFEPLGFGFEGVPGDIFDVVDWIAAGVLMGLGTDYVHQIISVVTKGQRYLGAATGRPAPQTVKIDIGEVKRDFGTQIDQAGSVLDQRFKSIERALSELGVNVEEDPPAT